MLKSIIPNIIYQTSYYRAEDETRTRDPQLGRLMLYQLSYFRIFVLNDIKKEKQLVGSDGFEPPKLAQQIYSLPHLATLETAPLFYIAAKKRAEEGT